ncbi:MAG: conserved membrane protein of unknown function [Promethearchaeota archaeon]|nr:MAG: conserved membrane protein of unknown function [Candidatus Lokiarchaeota archaeon]
MEKSEYYKWLFIIGAIFNWIMASSFTLISIFFYSTIFSLFGSFAPPTLFFLHSLLGLIAVYGIGYFIVGLDIEKNRGVVYLGVLSKLAFFTYCLIYYLLGDLTIIIVILGSLDFFFALLFIEFLLSTKEN